MSRTQTGHNCLLDPFPSIAGGTGADANGAARPLLKSASCSTGQRWPRRALDTGRRDQEQCELHPLVVDTPPGRVPLLHITIEPGGPFTPLDGQLVVDEL